jgi:hypothetical protein
VVIAVSVGAAVAILAGISGAGGCAPGLDTGPGDSVCYDLVRTLSERVGVAAGAATAILVLTMVGLARTSDPGDPDAMV